MSDNLKYTFYVDTLSPLHIGSGARLREGFDFIADQSSIWIANIGALMRAILEEAAEADRQAGLAILIQKLGSKNLDDLKREGWLRPEHFRMDNGLFYYRLIGRLSAQEKGILFEQLKDIYHRPYLPASSLKGALRSLDMRARCAQDDRQIAFYKPMRYKDGQRAPNNEPKVAAQEMEKRYFVTAPQAEQRLGPNYDIWRSVRIADSRPLEVSKLALGHVTVFPAGAINVEKSDNLRFNLEAIPAGERFTFEVSLDGWLFDKRSAQLKFDPEFLIHRITIWKEEAKWDASRRINREYKFFRQVSQQSGMANNPLCLEAANYYRRLAEYYQNLRDDEMILQVGKGGGWLSKTLGQVLLEKLPEDKFNQFVADYKLGKGKWRYGGRVPLTRQLCKVGEGQHAPLGWVKIKMEARA